MGLPGSGKSYLSKCLVELFSLQNKTAEWYNADTLRTQYNDWDFSVEGRLRQAYRFNELATNSKSQYVICDFVCPLEEMRTILNPDYIIWMDTISMGRYEDTNKIFCPPNVYDIRVTEKDAIKWTKIIIDSIVGIDK